jgi:hypothetical protein
MLSSAIPGSLQRNYHLAVAVLSCATAPRIEITGRIGRSAIEREKDIEASGQIPEKYQRWSGWGCEC